MFGDGENVLVTAPAQIHQDDLAFTHRRRQLGDVRQRMGRFQRRDDPFGARTKLECLQRFLIGRRYIFNAADVVERGMLGPNPWITQSSADRVSLDNLPIVVLQKIGTIAMKNTGAPSGQAGGMFASLDTMATSFHADKSHRGVIEEGMEQTHGVGATSNA